MNILMMTNSYKPYVGGIEKSIALFTNYLRQAGHRVKIVAPDAGRGYAEEDPEIFRVPAIQNFNNSNMPLVIPYPGIMQKALDDFEPDIIHSHYPFLIGSAALREAAHCHVPLVFTYHTMYEKYIHYMSMDSDAVRMFVAGLAKGYANLSDQVIAPSGSVARLLRERGVAAPIEVIPTGVEMDRFAQGSRSRGRRKWNIPEDTFLLGHVGRLTPEKNLGFLADSIVRLFDLLEPEQREKVSFLIAGSGISEDDIVRKFTEKGFADKLIMTGVLEGLDLIDTYHAMDLFVYSSLTETQGMVILEAFSCCVPVVALAGPGVVDVVQDMQNGRLVSRQEPDLFAGTVREYLDLSEHEKNSVRQRAVNTAENNSITNCTQILISIYERLVNRNEPIALQAEASWKKTCDILNTELELLKNVVQAAGHTISKEPPHFDKTRHARP